MGPALTELRDRDALERVADVATEAIAVQRDLGSPPLVSPITEIVAIQAVYNVCDGDRYATISQEVKDYCLGLYGKPPLPIDGAVSRIVSGRDEPISLRPAELLDPALETARAELEREGLATSDEATVCYALFASDWLALVRGEATVEGLGEQPPEAATNVTVASTEETADPVARDEVASIESRELTVEVDGQSYAVRVSGPPGSFGSGGSTGGGDSATPGPAKAEIRDGTVMAPMQGLILKVSVKVGDKVELGQVVAVLEAMKMQNDIPATKAGTISEVFVEQGAVVSPRDRVVQID